MNHSTVNSPFFMSVAVLHFLNPPAKIPLDLRAVSRQNRR